MAGYTFIRLKLDDTELSILQHSDPALVAAGLTAIWSSAPVFTAAVLAQGGVSEEATANLQHGKAAEDPAFYIQSTTSLGVAKNGTIEPLVVEDVKGKSVLGGLLLELSFQSHTQGQKLTEQIAKDRLGELIELLRAFLDSHVRIELMPLVGPMLDFAVPAIRARPVELPPLPRRDGTGVIIGVADWGCDFAHPAFLHPDGSTRLLYLWDQNPPPPLGGAGALGPFGLGQVFDATAINAALATADPYFALGYNPVTNAFEEQPPVHGTHVLSVAGGSAAQGVPPGVAPGADLIFVNLPPDALLSVAGRLALIEAVLWIFNTATTLGRPAVVNLSLGTNHGPHDGSNNLEMFFDWVLGQPVQVPGRVIVVPAGNAHREALHAQGTIPLGGDLSFTWEFQRGDNTLNTLDIWYDTGAPAPLLLTTLVAPGNVKIEQAGPAMPLLILYAGRPVGSLTTGTWSPNGNPPFRQNIHIEIAPQQVIAEEWEIQLQLPAGPGPIVVDAWVNRDDYRVGTDTQSNIRASEADPLGTLASLSCGFHTICAGAYYEIPPRQPPGYFSSAGPTRDGRPKPDVAAPGYEVQAANAWGGQHVDADGGLDPHGPIPVPLVAAMSGTSVSAAFVSGLAALLLQTQPGSTADQIADQIRAWTRLRPPTRVPPLAFQPPPRNWEPQLGYGRIDARNTLWNW